MALSAKSLRKAVVHPLLLNPSPANLQSTRLALHVDGGGSSCSVYIASGCRVYKVQISMEDSTTVTTGKESLLIPVQAEVIHSSSVNRCPHRSEIQSVVLAEMDCNSGVILGTVDSYGHLIVSRLDTSGEDVERHTYSVLPRDCGIGEGSWAGMCFSPQHWSTAAVARALCKSIDIYEQDVHIQCLRTLWNPASLCFLSSSLSGNGSSSMLAVAEGCQLTIWDLRTNYNGGCVQRICSTVGDCLYAVCSSFDGAIAAGGSDRTVTIYDPRRWSALKRWANCSKYEITGLTFSSLDSNHLYVQGVDYEVFCGQWKESRKALSFRGDANWLGFGKSANMDILAGWSECGSIFVADVVKEYGPLWRLLRRNLMSEILHPSKVKIFAQGREWVLKMLIEEVRRHADSGEPFFVAESFQYAMFCLLLFMSFGQKLDESTVKKIKDIQQSFLARSPIFDDLLFFSNIGKILFRGRLKKIVEIRREQEELLLPLIRARKHKNQNHQDDNIFLFSYVDSLLDVELPDEGGRKFTEGEIVSLCSEFLNAGTDTTSTSVQWIMANLVKNPEIQQKLVDEIERVVGKEAEMVREEDLNAMPYLKAVIMEGLRRHPPIHFVLPHAVSEEVTFEGYVIPKDATINFLVADMGMDEKVWDEPMEFRPERFLDGGGKVDITGTREIKMMPFGGRRICPGLNLAMLHLEYFVANLVKEFEWKIVDGEEVDLTEKEGFTIVMKNPLKAKITPRKM